MKGLHLKAFVLLGCKMSPRTSSVRGAIADLYID